MAGFMLGVCCHNYTEPRIQRPRVPSYAHPCDSPAWHTHISTAHVVPIYSCPQLIPKHPVQLNFSSNPESPGRRIPFGHPVFHLLDSNSPSRPPLSRPPLH